MIHCLLTYQTISVDLTGGNQNGKNRPIQDFLFTQVVTPIISAKEEYLIYRNVLMGQILERQDMKGITIKQILQAREDGLVLLKNNIRF